MFTAHIDDIDKTRIQSVAEHSFETAALAAKYAEKLNLTKTAEIQGLLHDLGSFALTLTTTSMNEITLNAARSTTLSRVLNICLSLHDPPTEIPCELRQVILRAQSYPIMGCMIGLTITASITLTKEFLKTNAMMKYRITSARS